MNTLTRCSWMLALIALSGCATSHLAWKPGDGKDGAAMSAESESCLVSVAHVSPGKFGDRREKAYLNCMAAHGHQLVSVED